MKTAIIGAGNMGGAIARGLAKGTVIKTGKIWVANPNNEKLELLKSEFPEIQITNSNQEAANGADIIILAVKPWYVKLVLSNLKINPDRQILLSVASGINFEQLVQSVGKEMTIFRIIPNTAISQLNSMTLISSYNASKEQERLVIHIFDEMGISMLMAEDKLDAATALGSCGIAYVLKYIQAAIQAGTEMGISPKDSQTIVAQAAKGAAELLLKTHTHPSVEIDKVTTPGGITIKGINELEHAGFASAIIRAMKVSR